MILKFIKKQFIDVIQWPQPEEGVLVWRFPTQDQAIQTGAMLTVRESQKALFIDNGKVADSFEPGMYRLTTDLLPLLSDLKHWTKLFEAPFKSDVYFFNTKLQIGRKWGTAQPINVRDQEFGMIAMRAFGMYSYRIIEPKLFFKEISGVGEEYLSDQLEQQLRNLIIASLSSQFGNAEVSFIDMAANQQHLSQIIMQDLQTAFSRWGLFLDSLAIENVNLPAQLQETLNKRMSMGVVGDLNAFTKYQTAASISLAAQNEGGIAGVGAGMAVGMGMGQTMMQNMHPTLSSQTNATETAILDPQQRLTQLKALLDKQLITQQDYDNVKDQLLKQFIDK